MNVRIRYVTPLASVALSLGAASTFAQTTSTERVSVDSAGVQGNGQSSFDVPSISADGRFVAFVSQASNLVPGDTNAVLDVFVRDRANGTTQRVSVDSAGAQVAGGGSAALISADGRFVAFSSTATSLVAGDTNSAWDAFVRDRVSGTTERVSIATSGAQGNAASFSAAITPGGRFVVFSSSASNLVAGDTNAVDDVFVRDRQTSTTERVSLATSGAEGNAVSSANAISSDGRFVVFTTYASNFAAGDTNGAQDCFVRDRSNGTTQLVSVSMAGAPGDAQSFGNAISADGRWVGFWSTASNLVPGDTNSCQDVFVRDMLSGTTERVSLSSSGTQANNMSIAPALSSNGRFVAFNSWASNLVTGDANNYGDVFVRDRATGLTERVSVSTAGSQGNGSSAFPAISADGRFVAFASDSSNFATADTNGVYDAFVRERWQVAPHAYCTAGTTTNGCSASITANSNPSFTLANPCNITVGGVEGLKTGLLFYGIYNLGFAPGPWAPGSTSWLCVKHPTQRTPVQNSGGTFGACNGSYVLDWNAFQSAHPLALGNPWSAGDKVCVQAWFRDPPAVKGTNLSNALELTYVP